MFSVVNDDVNCGERALFNASFCKPKFIRSAVPVAHIKQSIEKGSKAEIFELIKFTTEALLENDYRRLCVSLETRSIMLVCSASSEVIPLSSLIAEYAKEQSLADENSAWQSIATELSTLTVGRAQSENRFAITASQIAKDLMFQGVEGDLASIDRFLNQVTARALADKPFTLSNQDLDAAISLNETKHTSLRQIILQRSRQARCPYYLCPNLEPSNLNDFRTYLWYCGAANTASTRLALNSLN